MRDRIPDVVLYTRALFNGGTDQVMLNLAIEFARRGLVVRFVVDTHNPYSPFVSKLPEDVGYVVLDAESIPARLSKLRAYLIENTPKVLISAGYFPNIFAILARRLADVDTRVVVTEHNSPTVNRKQSRWWEARHWFTFFARLMYPHAHAIVAVSNGTARDLAKETGLPLERISTIYNPVVGPDLYEAAKQPLDHPWFNDPQVPVLLAVGRLEPQKNYASLIRAFALVIRKRPCRLVILGDGYEREALERLIATHNLSEHVQLAGFAPNPHAYTARAAALVLSSVWEGLSCVLIEALALGTPTVSTDCPFGPSEVLDGGKYGTLVPVGDDAALADAILKTLERPRSEVPNEWLEQFTTRRAADRYLQVAGLNRPGAQNIAEQALSVPTPS